MRETLTTSASWCRGAGLGKVGDSAVHKTPRPASAMPCRAVPPIDAAAAWSQYATYDEWLRRTRKAESQYWGSVSKRLSERSVAGRPTPTDARFLACSTVYIHRHSGRGTMVVRPRGPRTPSEQHCGLRGYFTATV